MSRLPSKPFVSSGLRQQIDARCAEFQRAWTTGQTPRMEDYLAGFSDVSRPYLLEALLAVEIAQRRHVLGESVSEAQLLAAHPELATELRPILQHWHLPQVAKAAQKSQLPETAIDVEQTLAPSVSRDESGGLHIRCPHCRNAVELLQDMPYDSINCKSCGSMFSLIDPDETLGMTKPLQTIDRFEIMSRLGAGGFGTVWKARDRELDRIVAVKIPRKGQLGPTDADAFFREARAAAQLRHPNIVPVHEVGRDGETLFIVSDFVLGVDLSNWLTGKSPSAWDVAEYCALIADALHHAHQKGIVHRDLKPSNVMIDEAGVPHLMDFGLAKREVGEITMTVDGQVLGTPAYMSPEQAGGQSHWTDRRTDIYSLGVMMFEMLTGELPYRGNPQMQMYQRIREDPPDPRTLNRTIPRDLATICLKCIEREVGRRYANAAELRDELRRFLNGEPIHSRPISRPERAVRWARRKPLLATVAALVIFLAIAGPSAAFVIDRQRNRLAELAVENGNVIEQNVVEKRNDTNRITELSKRLDLWEGRANPWHFWPPKEESSERKGLLARFLEHATKSVDGKLQDAGYAPIELACGYLGLAILNDENGRAADAISFYRRAYEQLAALNQDKPDDANLSFALAHCSLDLARLLADEDREAAKRYLQSATEILQKLVSDHPGDATYKCVWLEAELASATMSEFDAGKVHLQRVSAIKNSLPTQWPTDPAEVYRVACFLAHRDANLLAQDSAEAQ